MLDYILGFQTETSNNVSITAPEKRGGRRYLPYAYGTWSHRFGRVVKRCGLDIGEEPRCVLVLGHLEAFLLLSTPAKDMTPCSL
jgi:hypothetical protein